MKYAKKTYKRTFKKSGKKSIRKSSSSLKQIVKKEMLKQAEPKYCDNTPSVYTWNASNTTMAAAVDLSVAYNLAQGTGQGDRIGNQITITNAVLNLNMLATTGSSPQILTIFIGYIKDSRSTLPNAGTLATIFQDGNSSTGINETTLSLLRNINHDRFACSRYTFKIGNNNSGGTTFNNDFPSFINKKISLSKVLGNVTWQTDGSTGVHTKNLYMWCQSTSIYNGSQAMAYMPVLNYFVDVKFKDI